MAKKRKEAEKLILDTLALATPNNPWLDVLKKKMSDMSDKEFDIWIRNKMIHLQVPNGSAEKMKVDNFFKAAESIGHDYFEKIQMEDPATGTVVETSHKYLVCDPPVRRLKQTTQKGISVPTSVDTIDQRTGQVAGNSKSSKLSMPELQVLHGQGKDNAIVEFIKIRGGDLDAQRVMVQALMDQGTVTQELLTSLGTQTKSVQTTDILLKAMHLDNNLSE